MELTEDNLDDIVANGMLFSQNFFLPSSHLHSAPQPLLATPSHIGTLRAAKTTLSTSHASSSTTSSIGLFINSQSIAPSSVITPSQSSSSGRVDNFRDFETVLHRTSEVEAFLTENSASTCFSSFSYVVELIK